jgi:hypothetical protein
VPFLPSPLAWWRANSAHLKELGRQYGYLAVGTYLGIYVVTLSGLFAAVRAGVVSGPDVNAFLSTWWVSQRVFGPGEWHLSEVAVDFGTAWLLTKTTEPLRLVATIPAVPFIAKRAPAGLLRFFRVPEHVIAARGTSASASVQAAAAPAPASAASGAPTATGSSDVAGGGGGGRAAQTTGPRVGTPPVAPAAAARSPSGAQQLR